LPTSPRFEKKHGKEPKIAPVFALAQNASSHPTMTSAEGFLPCFTTTGTNRLFHAHRLRWLTAREKAAASGLPVSPAQAEAAGVAKEIDWKSDFAWHTRIGNGQVLQNVGMVIISILSCLKMKEKVPPSIFHIEAPNFPKGLTADEGGGMILEVSGENFKLADKNEAVQAHKAVHASWQRFLSLEGR
jgi:hypothetical protein